MRLAALQLRPPHGRPGAARRRLLDALDEAISRGADLVVAPEMATTGYVWRDAGELLPHAEPADGPTCRLVADRCRAGGCAAVVGFAEQAADGLYNSALLIDRQGRLVAVYRKVLLYALDRSWARPGRERVVCDLAGLRVAPAICMDLNDDRFVAWLHRASPEVLAFCTNWLDEGLPAWRWWEARLAGWRGWFVAANRWGAERGVAFCGGSGIMGPEGRWRARAASRGDEVLVVDTGRDG